MAKKEEKDQQVPADGSEAKGKRSEAKEESDFQKTANDIKAILEAQADVWTHLQTGFQIELTVVMKQLPQAFIAREQFDDRAHHAQLGACHTARAHSPQPTIASHMRGKRAAKFRQDGESNGNKREHPCPRLETTDAGLGKTEQAFRVTEAFFTGEPTRIFGSHRMSRQVAVRQQVPDAPAPAPVTRARLHEKHLPRIALGVPDATHARRR